MKTHIKLSARLVLPAFAGLSSFAQGSLTPPGAPAPTMKSLTQAGGASLPRTGRH